MILVTGGAGFVGTNLVRRLLSEGRCVIVIDNLSTGNADSLPRNDSLTFIRDDITGHFWRMRIPEGVKEIYHLACPASPKAYQRLPLETLNASIIGTINVLSYAAQNKAKIVFSSTSEVYGDPKEHPQKETYWGNVNPIGPRSMYDEGKRCAETFCVEWRKRYKVDVKIARIFNTYGPYMARNDGRVISNFIMQALNGEKITVYGDGSQTRSFCYVDDTVDGLIRLMRSEDHGPINIGSQDEIRISGLAHLIGTMMGVHSSASYEHMELPPDDPSRRKPSIAKAASVLEWVPVTSLEAGLQRTIDYFKSVSGKSDPAPLFPEKKIRSLL